MARNRVGRTAGRGYSLSELIIGSAVMAAFLVGVYVVYAMTRSSADYEDFVQELEIVGGKVQTTFKDAPDYGGVTARSVAGDIPRRYAPAAGSSNLRTAYKNPMSVTAYPGGQDNSGFGVSSVVPTSVCYRMVTQDLGRTVSGVIIGDGKLRTYPLTGAAGIEADCGSGPTTQITWVYADKAAGNRTTTSSPVVSLLNPPANLPGTTTPPITDGGGTPAGTDPALPVAPLPGGSGTAGASTGTTTGGSASSGTTGATGGAGTGSSTGSTGSSGDTGSSGGTTGSTGSGSSTAGGTGGTGAGTGGTGAGTATGVGGGAGNGTTTTPPPTTVPDMPGTTIPCTGVTAVASNSSANFGACDGGQIRGSDGGNDYGGQAGQGNGISAYWSSASGNASGWWYGYDNGVNQSSLTLVGLNPSDVILTRAPDPNWDGNPDNLVITNVATGKSITITREMSGNPDGIGKLTFADGTTLDRAGIIAAAPERPACDGTVSAAADNTKVVFGTCDGAMVKGSDSTYYGGQGGDGRGLGLVWSATSGNAEAWWAAWDNVVGGNPSHLQLQGLNPGDVTITRGNGSNDNSPYTDLVITNNLTGKSITITKEFDGNNQNGVVDVTFANGQVLTRSDLLGVAAVIPKCTGLTQVTDGTRVEASACGGVIGGNNSVYGNGNGGGGKGIVTDWSSTSGNTTQWNYDSDNNTNPTTMSKVNLTDLNPSDVTLSRTWDPYYNAYDNLTVTNNKTGATMTVIRQFSGSTGDGVGQLNFANGVTLTASDLAKTVPVYVPCTGTTQVPDGTRAVIGACGGTVAGGNGLFYQGTGGNGKAVSVDWSSTSGSATQWNYDSNNNSSPATASMVNLTDLKSSDVTFSRTWDPYYNAYDNMTITNNKTGATMTVIRQFSGGTGDGVAKVNFADGTSVTAAALMASVPVYAPCTGTTQVPDYASVIVGACGGTVAGGDGLFSSGPGGFGKGITTVWSSTSGSGTSWAYAGDNNSSPSTTSTLALSDLKRSDVSLTRTYDQYYGANDNLTVTNLRTGTTMTVIRQFSGGSGDGIGKLTFSDGSVMTAADIAAAAA